MKRGSKGLRQEGRTEHVETIFLDTIFGQASEYTRKSLGQHLRYKIIGRVNSALKSAMVVSMSLWHHNFVGIDPKLTELS